MQTGGSGGSGGGGSAGRAGVGSVNAGIQAAGLSSAVGFGGGGTPSLPFGIDEDKYEKVLQLNTKLGESFEVLGRTISNSLTASGKIFNAFVGAIAQGLAKYISAQIAANTKVIALRKAGASADAIKAATDTAASTPGVGAFILPGLIAAALSVVTGAFSGGGGGGGGGAASVPAAPRPQGGFTPVGGGAGQVVFEIGGDKLIGVLQASGRNRSNFTGTDFNIGGPI